MTAQAPVWMRHPGLPADQVIPVAPANLRGHLASGWVKTDPPAPKPAPDADAPQQPAAADTAAPPAQPADTPPDQPKRRRAPKETSQ